MATPCQVLIGLPSIFKLGLPYYSKVPDRVVERVVDANVQVGDQYVALLMM